MINQHGRMLAIKPAFTHTAYDTAKKVGHHPMLNVKQGEKLPGHPQKIVQQMARSDATLQ